MSDFDYEEKSEPAEASENLEDKEHANDALEDNKETLVLLLAKDYGGGIAIPHYGCKRPSADYFNSNLMT